MGTTIIAAAGGAVVALLVVALVGVLRRRNRSRADLEAMLAAAQRESDDLRARLEELSARHPEIVSPTAANAPAYLITDAGSGTAVDVPGVEAIAVPDRLVLSATLGAPLVKVAAFGHGLRRALNPENRNRIRFEMRREVRAARKRRRQRVKDYQRAVRAEDRAKEGLA